MLVSDMLSNDSKYQKLCKLDQILNFMERLVVSQCANLLY